MGENEKSIFDTAEVTNVTPEDGMVPLGKLKPNDLGKRGQRFYGWGTTFSFTGSGPGVHKVFVRFVTGFLLLISLIFLSTGSIILPGIVIVFTLFCYKKLMGDIEQRAAEQKVPLPETPEEIHAVQQEFTGEMKEALKASAQNTFTEKSICDFRKTAGIVCLIVGILLTVILFCVSKFMGILAAVCLVMGWIVYNVFLKWIVTRSQKNDN